MNVLFTITTKPSNSQCHDLAKKFVLKYPCGKDELRNGYVSGYMSYLARDLFKGHFCYPVACL